MAHKSFSLCHEVFLPSKFLYETRIHTRPHKCSSVWRTNESSIIRARGRSEFSCYLKREILMKVGDMASKPLTNMNSLVSVNGSTIDERVLPECSCERNE